MELTSVVADSFEDVAGLVLREVGERSEEIHPGSSLHAVHDSAPERKRLSSVGIVDQKFEVVPGLCPQPPPEQTCHYHVDNLLFLRNFCHPPFESVVLFLGHINSVRVILEDGV